MHGIDTSIAHRVAHCSRFGWIGLCALQKRELDFAVKRIQTLEQQVKRDRSIMAVLDSRNRTAALKVSSCPSISNRRRWGRVHCNPAECAHVEACGAALLCHRARTVPVWPSRRCCCKESAPSVAHDFCKNVHLFGRIR